ncbi:Aste57867_17289 [Aphanomyces stellatus]|uniref:Aste57867_17289 protein n=1 Tax=Aphanomyces stellatus TaxID=120398 RepID=A0A485L7H9_9STRA|nr:hypothetical protein As57867_017230 [Aphanomyces stellatus]VFT94045.1 Aste57867_17289 [Aphanomyces stellatus]
MWLVITPTAYPHMSKVKNARMGQLTRSACCTFAVRDSAVALFTSVDATELEPVFAKEVADLKELNELARDLEDIALDDADQDGYLVALNDVGIEPNEMYDA